MMHEFEVIEAEQRTLTKILNGEIHSDEFIRNALAVLLRAHRALRTDKTQIEDLLT